MLETYRFEDKATLTLSFATPSGPYEVTTTELHPFFVEGKGWTASRELELGDRVPLKDGGTASLAATAPEGGLTTVYNFAVDTDHTYFIGEEGLWVHNVCQARELELTGEESTSTERIAVGDTGLPFSQENGTATVVMPTSEALALIDDLGGRLTGDGTRTFAGDGDVSWQQASGPDDSKWLLVDAPDGNASPVQFSSYEVSTPSGPRLVYLISRGENAVIWNGFGGTEITGAASLVGSGLGVDVFFSPSTAGAGVVETKQRRLAARNVFTIADRITKAEAGAAWGWFIAGELAFGAVTGGAGAYISAALKARAALKAEEALLRVDVVDDGYSASIEVGRLGAPIDVPKGTNTRTVIKGREYSGHALDRMQGRGLVPSVVESAIQFGRRSPDAEPGKIRFYSAVNDITVVTDAESGRVVTVITGKLK